MKRIESVLIVLASFVVLLGSCSEGEPSETAVLGATTVRSAQEADCATDIFACARLSMLGDFVPAAPIEATGKPLTLGMINQENTPLSSFPELSQATRTAIKFVNEQLGGVDGHPIELKVCNTGFSAEGSTKCGQEMVEAKVPAVLGGIDVFGNGVDVLADNDIPFIGGIPVSNQSVTSPNSFQWSGGSWGASVAFADYAATTLKAKKVAILYADFGSLADSANHAKTVLERAGVQGQLVPHPIVTTDLTSSVQAAMAGKPDALIMLEADSGCKASFEARQTLAVTVPTFYVGACVAPAIVDQLPVSATDGAIFNVEGPIVGQGNQPDTELYRAIVDRYGDGLNPSGAGTITFRAFMNLYVVLRSLGFEGINPQAIATEIRSKVNEPSFAGHPYTCDQQQFEGLPAMCAPQEILARMKDRRLSQLGSWIDVGAIYAG